MTEQTIRNTSKLQTQSMLARIVPVFSAVLLGIVILAGVGFASGLPHNAAHDTRHVMVFPCH